MKKHPPEIHPRINCVKFPPKLTIFEVSSLPQSFSLVLGKNCDHALKNENFEKMKNA